MQKQQITRHHSRGIFQLGYCWLQRPLRQVVCPFFFSLKNFKHEIMLPFFQIPALVDISDLEIIIFYAILKKIIEHILFIEIPCHCYFTVPNIAQLVYIKWVKLFLFFLLKKIVESFIIDIFPLIWFKVDRPWPRWKRGQWQSHRQTFCGSRYSAGKNRRSGKLCPNLDLPKIQKGWMSAIASPFHLKTDLCRNITLEA